MGNGQWEIELAIAVKKRVAETTLFISHLAFPI